MRLRLLIPLACLVAACDPEEIERVEPDPKITGVVQVEGLPAASFEVNLTTQTGIHRDTTDAMGEFEFIGRSGTVSVTARDSVVFVQPSSAVFGQGNEHVQFNGYRPRPVSGRISWDYGPGRYNLAGVTVQWLGSPFPLPVAVTSDSGLFEFPRAPALGIYTMKFGSLPGGLVFSPSDSGTIAVTPDRRVLDPHVTYLPPASLYVRLIVDGQPFTNATINLATPIPVSARASGLTLFHSLPVSNLNVTLSNIPPTVQFDSLSKRVQLHVFPTIDTLTFTGVGRPANRPPVVTISTPLNGASFVQGTGIAFAGQGIDPEDGALSGNALRWTSSLQGVIGTGTVFARENLSAGLHRIVLRATDQAGLSDSTSVDITVSVAPGRLTGTVTIFGVPTPNVRINLSTNPAQFATTDAQGIYRFENLPPGTYNVTVVPPSFVTFSPATQSVTITAGQTATVNFVGFTG